MANENSAVDLSIIEEIVGDTWNTYLAAAVEPCTPRGKPASQPSASTEVDQDQVDASVRIFGEVVREVTLRGSWSSATEATRRMLQSGDSADGGGGCDVSIADEDVLDAWGELVNTVAGNLKASLDLEAQQLSMPEVVRDRSTPAPTPDATELLFEWDGYLAVVRVAKVRPV